MRDVDDLRDLKRQYVELVRIHGEDVSEFKRFKQSLLALNQRHRLEAAKMYMKMIEKIEKKVGTRKARE